MNNKIHFNVRGLESIVDCRLGKVVAAGGTLDIIAEDDIGSLWDRLKKLDVRHSMSDFADVSVSLHDGDYAKLIIEGNLKSPIEWQVPESWSMILATVRGTEGRPLPRRHSFLRNHGNNILVPVVKGAEDGDGFVVRMAEGYGKPGSDSLEGALV